MSGIELFGLVTGIVTILEATLKIYRAAQNTSELPESFRWAASRLPLLRNTLSTVESRLTIALDDRPDLPNEAVTLALQACREKAEALRDIFCKTLCPREAPWLERWKRGRQQLKMADRVRDLVGEMNRDLQALVGNQVLGGVMTDMWPSHEMPSVAADRTLHSVGVSKESMSDDLRKSRQMRFYSFGTGHQTVHAGYGDQINNFGSGWYAAEPSPAPTSTAAPEKGET